MCSIAAVSLAMTVAATAMSVAGQAQQQRTAERTAKSTAEYNAQVAENEAAVQQQLAQNEIAKGVAERSQQQRQAARALGTMRASMGASGFQMDTGSMVSLLEESATEHQYDSSVISSNAQQAAWQHLVGATSAQNNMNFANWQGANATSGRTGAILGMGGTLLGGIASGISGYNQLSGTSTPTAGNTFRQNAGKTQYTQYGFSCPGVMKSRALRYCPPEPPLAVRMPA